MADAVGYFAIDPSYPGRITWYGFVLWEREAESGAHGEQGRALAASYRETVEALNKIRLNPQETYCKNCVENRNTARGALPHGYPPAPLPPREEEG